MPDEETTGDGPEEDADTEVLSFAMTDRDDTDTPGDEEPHLTPSEPDAGFDGWLDDAKDPYRELSEEGDPAEEVADWLAFARGEEGEEEEELISSPLGGGAEPSEAEGAGAGLPPTGDETEEADEDDGDTSEFDLPPSEDDTGEIPAVVGETDSSDDDTGEVPIVDAATTEAVDDVDEVVEPHELDAVVEMEAIDASADFEIEDIEEKEDEEEEAEEEPEPPPIDDFTAEDYLGAATQDHVELAAAVAAAEEEVTEQVALSADIPGLESTSVGFEDVVEETETEMKEEEAAGTSDLLLRVGTAVALVGALLLSLLWRPALIVFVLAVFIVAAGEFYSALIQRRFKPMSLFGFLGIAGAALGTAAWGVVAIPVSLALMTTVLLLFSAVSPRRDQPAANFSLTMLVAVWIGGLGAFAFDIIAAEDFQVLVIVLVATVALVDIAAFFVGGSIGKRPLAPVISPKKTIEGLIAGTLTGLAVGAAISYLVDSIDLPAGLLLGAVVAVFAPIGDLAVSVVKRSLDIKDMGSILPGHGGLLDRIDAVIAVIPAVWVVLTWLALI